MQSMETFRLFLFHCPLFFQIPPKSFETALHQRPNSVLYRARVHLLEPSPESHKHLPLQCELSLPIRLILFDSRPRRKRTAPIPKSVIQYPSISQVTNRL
jgi:hypothetical protein